MKQRFNIKAWINESRKKDHTFYFFMTEYLIIKPLENYLYYQQKHGMKLSF